MWMRKSKAARVASRPPKAIFRFTLGFAAVWIGDQSVSAESADDTNDFITECLSQPAPSLELNPRTSQAL